VNLTTIGEGALGGGLARRWNRAGHNLTLLGHDGGACGADLVVVAVLGRSGVVVA
jgi:8-hydroxy-5-deazaflavin:NADPH oxidoreductase